MKANHYIEPGPDSDDWAYAQIKSLSYQTFRGLIWVSIRPVYSNWLNFESSSTGSCNSLQIRLVWLLYVRRQFSPVEKLPAHYYCLKAPNYYHWYLHWFEFEGF